MKRGLLTFIIFSCLGIAAAFAQVVDPTSWSSSSKKIADDEYELTFKANIQPGWHIYSAYTPDGGALRTTLEIAEIGSGVELTGTIQESEPVKQYNDIFKVDELYFENEYIFSQKIKVTDPVIAAVHATVAFQVCEESCINLEKDFEFKLEGRTATSVNEGATIYENTDASGLEKYKDNLILFFLVSFLGGLLAIVTPCVFPMIPMTVSFFMHGDSNKAKARGKALFFGLSIVAIYTVLGLIISFIFGPGFLNWISTNWVPNLFFFLIFIFFAASLFGAFELVLPAKWVNKSDAKADKGGYMGAFFMALTLVLVSFSCTVPIVSFVLVEASQGSVLRPIVGMLGFSIAMALPFAFFAFFPSKLSNLPKSGGWLNSVKVVLGFIEVALGFKFLMVIDQTYHLGILDREVYIAIWIVVFALMGFYLLGKIKFKHDSDVPYVGVGRLALVIFVFSFVVYLIPGMWGAPLKALAGYMPPQTTIDFDIDRIVRQNADAVIKSGVSAGGGKYVSPTAVLDEPIKYSSFLELPLGIEGYFDYDQAVRAAQALDRPLFIDFTGHGCVNCREMENSVWSDLRVLEVLKNEYLVVALYVDDKTKLPEDEVYISDYDGKKKNTLGKKNTDFQIKKFSANSQPNYILLDSRRGFEEDLAPHVLQPARAWSLNIEAFLDFLNKGVEEYKKRK